MTKRTTSSTTTGGGRFIRLSGPTLFMLANRAVPLEDTPNSVIRRLLGLDPPVRIDRDSIPPDPADFRRGRTCRVDSRVFAALTRRRKDLVLASIDEAVQSLALAAKRRRP